MIVHGVRQQRETFDFGLGMINYLRNLDLGFADLPRIQTTIGPINIAGSGVSPENWDDCKKMYKNLIRETPFDDIGLVKMTKNNQLPEKCKRRSTPIYPFIV